MEFGEITMIMWSWLVTMAKSFLHITPSPSTSLLQVMDERQQSMDLITTKNIGSMSSGSENNIGSEADPNSNNHALDTDKNGKVIVYKQ